MIYIASLDSPRLARREALRRRWLGWLQLVFGIALGMVGVVGLGFTFLLVYGPYPWDPMLFGVGVPGGLILGCVSLSAALIGAVFAIRALRTL
jgi:hypothetical protein